MENKEYVENMAMYLQAANEEGATEAPPCDNTGKVDTTAPTPLCARP